MDEESKQLLREIRDAALRDEAARKRLVGAASVLAVMVLGLSAFLVFRLERMLTEIEAAPAPAAVRG